MGFPVSQKKNENLLKRMTALGIREKDLKESFVRSGGPGGQNVNKVATCVVLKHLPTGISVKCQKGRSQAMNRYYARCLLIKKIDQKMKGEASEEAKRIAKIKRQKRKRSKRAKEKILDAKKRRGVQKKLRQRINPHCEE